MSKAVIRFPKQFILFILAKLNEKIKIDSMNILSGTFNILFYSRIIISEIFSRNELHVVDNNTNS